VKENTLSTYHQNQEYDEADYRNNREKRGFPVISRAPWAVFEHVVCCRPQLYDHDDEEYRDKDF